MFDRLVLTEGLMIQTVIVEMTRNLCIGHPSARRQQRYAVITLGQRMEAHCIRTSPTDENLSEDIDQLFELTKIMVLVLSGLVPGLEDSNIKGKLS